MAAVRYPFTIYLVDTSVVARRELTPVRNALAELQQKGELATCPQITAEVCYSARNTAEYQTLRQLMGEMILLNSDDRIEESALDAQEKLARTGQHRTSIIDLFAAAVATAHGAVLLHYDSDYDRIGPAVEAKTQWVVPRGSV